MKYRFGKEDRERLEAARRHLAGHLDGPVKVTVLCGVAMMSRQKLNAGFEKFYGKPVRFYFVQLRMEKGRELLLHSEESVGAIATGCGYEHPENFSAAYKRFWGCTPSEERRKARGD